MKGNPGIRIKYILMIRSVRRSPSAREAEQGFDNQRRKATE